jgi:hypothetical protein
VWLSYDCLVPESLRSWLDQSKNGEKRQAQFVSEFPPLPGLRHFFSPSAKKINLPEQPADKTCGFDSVYQFSTVTQGELPVRTISQEDDSWPEMTFSVAAHHTLATSAENLEKWRKQPGGPVPGSLLRHADEQTVAGLQAVMAAARYLPGQVFTDWGVVAAPRLMGRAMMAQALQKYQEEGAWGVSPHLIPHRSLHSLSGSISQAFGICGPNFGVGGGATGAAEALCLASSLLADNLPGLWVVLTGYHPEFVPDRAAVDRATPGQCWAAALALRPARGKVAGPQFTLLGGNNSLQYPLFTLEEICLALQSDWLGRKGWRLPHGGALYLERWQARQERRAA